VEINFGGKVLFFGGQPARTARANNRDVEALNQNCDPTPLTRLYLDSHRWFDRGKLLSGLIYLNSIEAFLAAGKESTVIKMVEPMIIPHAGADTPPPTAGAYYYLSLSQAYTQLEKWEKAIETQNTAMSYFNRLEKKMRKYAGPIAWYLCLNGYTLQLHNGETEALEEKCLGLLSGAVSTREQVEAHFLLGKLCLSEKRKEEAEQHLNYVVQNGNKLLVRYEAELLLAKMQGTPLTGKQLIFAAGRACAKERYADAVALYEWAVSAGASDETTGSAEWRLEWASCLLCLGRFSDALEQIEQIQPFGGLDTQRKTELILFGYRAIAYTGLGRLEEATEAQNQAVALFEQGGAEGYRDLLCRIGIAIKIKLKEWDGLEEQIDALLKKEPETFQNQMLKAEFLLAAGRGQEARPYLEYVVQHAGEHRYHQEAQAALETL